MDVMVIDGGSRDRTEAIVAAYAQRYVNIRFLHNEKKIQSAAFNVGVACSTAPFIVRLDAHALYDKSYVERCVDGLKADRKRGNVGGGCTIEPTSNTLWAKANAILNHSRFGIGGASFRVGQQACNTDSVPLVPSVARSWNRWVACVKTYREQRIMSITLVCARLAMLSFLILPFAAPILPVQRLKPHVARCLQTASL